MPITKATASSIAAAAKGDLVVGSATNDADILAIGSANQVLTVDSSTDTGLKWATPASGGMTLLSTTTLSGAAVTVSSISGSYKNLAIFVQTMASATPTYPVFSSTSTTFYGYGTYGNTLTQYNLSSSGNIANSNAETQWSLQFFIYDYTNSNYKGWNAFGGNNGTTKFKASGMLSKTSAIDDITLTSGAGTFSGGTMLIYGVQ
jgi:hypothetical protein